MLARHRSDLVLASLDAVLVTSAYAGALLLRFDGSVPSHHWNDFVTFLPLVLAITLLANVAFGLYGPVWRHASIYEAQRLLLAGATAGVAVNLLNVPVRLAPASVSVLAPVVATLLMGAVRFQSRLFSLRRREMGDGLRVVVIGSGDAGAGLIAEMLKSPAAGYQPVAVLDEDRARHGRSLMGLRIEGAISDLPVVGSRYGAHVAVLAMSSVPPDVVRRAAEAAERGGIALKIVPGLAKTLSGHVTLHDVRDLRIEDLIGREQVETDLEAVTAMLRGRRVLVTGGGGSIGAEIARQVAECEPAQLVLLDHDETHLHDAAGAIDGEVVTVLADIRDGTSIRRHFEQLHPEVVFHAAAHKHVPLLEQHPAEAVLTNVVGTHHVLDAAAQVGVETLVFISTDKAVRPSSVMGATKRLGEQLVLAQAQDGRRYCAVRFGNVVGSRGSVVPTFVRQIASGGPVTVTDRHMTRYFMSIEEAVQLVLQAAALTEPHSGGAVYMLDMGEAVNIYDLAQRMIRLSGRRPGADIEIRITGPRPGEKLEEALVDEHERRLPTLHPAVARVEQAAITADLESVVLHLEQLALAFDDGGCRALLFEAVGPAPGRALADPGVS